MKKNWNRIFALCLTLALVFSLAACGQKADEPDAQDEQQTEQEEFTPASYSIAALKGPTAMGLVKLMKDSENGETTGNEYTFTLAGSADRSDARAPQGRARHGLRAREPRRRALQ